MKREWQDAAQRGDAAALKRLIDAGLDVDALDRYGQTALMLAAMRGHFEAARILVEGGARLDHTAKFHLSALMIAVINDHRSIVELLLAAGANTGIQGTGAPGFAGKTALDLAEDLDRQALLPLLRNR